jgi:hypothetical protein
VTLAEQLRDRAKEYELNALAARERLDRDTSMAFGAIAVVLLELADIHEEVDE